MREGALGLGSDAPLLPLRCVASGKCLPFSGPQFSPLQNEDVYSHILIVWSLLQPCAGSGWGLGQGR